MFSPCWHSSCYRQIPPLLQEYYILKYNSSLYVLKSIFLVKLKHLTLNSNKPPTCPLRPVIVDNTRPIRFTATAGTKLVGASSQLCHDLIVITGFTIRRPSFKSPKKQAGSSFRLLSKIPHCCLP